MSNQTSVFAPVPGIFYRQPSPTEPVYVNEGSTVREGDVIGLIEVMKNFYEVTATHAGILEGFRVDNEQIVDAGQELAVIKLE